MHGTSNQSTIRARELRRTMSLPEGLLWQVLRKRPGGFKFRRQHPLGPFIVDFYCPTRRLAIEVDGEVHNMGDNPARDAQRDEYVRLKGLRVVRFAATDVLRNMDGVLKTILAEASGQLPLPRPSDGPPPRPGGRGGTSSTSPALRR